MTFCFWNRERFVCSPCMWRGGWTSFSGQVWVHHPPFVQHSLARLLLQAWALMAGSQNTRHLHPASSGLLLPEPSCVPPAFPFAWLTCLALRQLWQAVCLHDGSTLAFVFAHAAAAFQGFCLKQKQCQVRQTCLGLIYEAITEDVQPLHACF